MGSVTRQATRFPATMAPAAGEGASGGTTRLRAPQAQHGEGPADPADQGQDVPRRRVGGGDRARLPPRDDQRQAGPHGGEQRPGHVAGWAHAGARGRAAAGTGCRGLQEDRVGRGRQLVGEDEEHHGRTRRRLPPLPFPRSSAAAPRAGTPRAPGRPPPSGKLATCQPVSEVALMTAPPVEKSAAAAIKARRAEACESAMARENSAACLGRIRARGSPRSPAGSGGCRSSASRIPAVRWFVGDVHGLRARAGRSPPSDPLRPRARHAVGHRGPREHGAGQRGRAPPLAGSGRARRHRQSRRLRAPLTPPGAGP
jgi:hypothetical protein